jgi:outer membrane receptor protein involved in Fe transport
VRFQPRRPSFLATFLLVAGLTHAASQTTAPAKSVEALLQDLRRSGVDVIYSSELVPPDLAAPAATEDTPLLQRVIDALAASGLELRAFGPKAYVVVRAAPKPAARAPPDPVETLEEISVYASRYSIEGRDVTEPQELSSSDIEVVPGSHDDALHALRSLPGFVSNASARPYIRGSLTEDVLIRYDGVTLLDPFHLKNFQSLISAVDPAAVERIEVFSGGFPVRYGARSGGVIDMTAPSPRSGYDNRAGISLFSAAVSSLGRSEKLPLEWVGSLRHSTLDKVDVVEDNFGKPQFADTLGRVRWHTDNGAWTLGWLLLDDRLELGTNGEDERASARYRDEYVWLARDHRFGENLRTRATLVTTSAERTRHGTLEQPGVANGQIDERRSFNGVELTNAWSYEPGDTWSYTFGGAVGVTNAASRYSRLEQFNPDVALAFDRPANNDLEVVVRPRVVTYALHGARRQQWENFEAEVGIRFDAQRYDLGGNHTQVSPRLNLRYDFNHRTRLYTSIGRFTQPQHVEEWRIEEAQQISDAAQVSIHTILGLEYRSSDDTRWGLEAYSKRWTTVAPYFDNSLDPLSLLPDLAPDRVRIQPKKSEATGLEVSVRRPLSDELTGFGTFTWSRVADDFVDGDVLRSWDQPLSVTAGLAWRGSRASVSGIAGWHRGWPRTPFQITPPEVGERNTERWGDYLTLDVRGAWNWTLSRGDLSAVLELTNATSRDNQCCLELSAPQTAPYLQAKIEHWLPIIVNLGVTYRWRNPR